MNPNSDDELLDLVDENDQIIGTVWKREAHQNPKLIHREISVTLFNNQGEVLLQQRSLQKKNNPGSWQTSCAGHVKSGETPLQAAEREVREEIMRSPVELTFFQKRYKQHENKEARFFYVYYGFIDKDTDLTPHPLEVAQLKWVKLLEFNEAIKHLKGMVITTGSYGMITDIAKFLKLPIA